MISEKEIRSSFIVDEIVKILKDKKMSIADISKNLNIKRSTLNYYLTSMEAKDIIERKRIEEGVTGSPAMISLKKSFVRNRTEKEDQQKMLNGDVLKMIMDKQPRKEKEIIDELLDKYTMAQIISTLVGLENFGYISKNYDIEGKGKKFLEENGKDLS